MYTAADYKANRTHDPDALVLKFWANDPNVPSYLLDSGNRVTFPDNRMHSVQKMLKMLRVPAPML